MSPTIEKLITIEEFVTMESPEDDSLEELIRGKIVRHLTAYGRYGLTCSTASGLVYDHVNANDLGFMTLTTGVILERNPDTLRAVHAGYWSYERQPKIPRGYFEIPPDLAIEVRSPHFRSSVEEKIEQFMNNGFPLVWVVDPTPGIHTVTIYEPNKKPVVLAETDTITGGDVLPEFSCKVIEFFQ